MSEVLFEIFHLYLRKPIHFLHSHAFVDKTDPLLKLNQLFIGHDVSVDVLSE